MEGIFIKTNKKFYVENAKCQRVVFAEDATQAAQLTVREMLEKGMNIQPLIMVSDYGFYNDIEKVHNKEMLNKVKIFSFSVILRSIGENYLADYVEKEIKARINNNEKNE